MLRPTPDDGMDASQYKDYVLVQLFIKYISDKSWISGIETNSSALHRCT